ncbi:hypothetical protein MesoLjLc_62710 [Mesorhizobium sp. L-8-10]|uniref:hypothetical protein n=1 Tax=Mesorhizobium sp. L-8-10 TaxID=2744523 RepID=UPI0019270E5A|nr:hypothetical protein [Mesorhizobium sp. L-8-10]BCH34341.1 hypothetical protein MesoLjLc_62710 [Mesorhizobium sp. L-8-10]
MGAIDVWAQVITERMARRPWLERLMRWTGKAPGQFFETSAAPTLAAMDEADIDIALLSASLDPHADFICEGGNASGHGVVLAEAHGSFAKDASAAKIANAAKRKYVKQVKPFIAKSSPFGEIIHGYSIALGSKPTVTGSFLAVSETRISKPRKRTPLPSVPQRGAIAEGTPAPMALATHRSNFLLMGAPEVTNWIDWIRLPDSPAPERHDFPFLRFGYAGRTYLAAPPRLLRPGGPPWWIEDFFDHPEWWRLARRARLWPSRHPGSDFGWFAVEEKAGAEFLNALSHARAMWLSGR